MGWQEDLANYPLTQEEAEIRARQRACANAMQQAQQAASVTGVSTMAGGGSIGPLTVGSMYANTNSTATYRPQSSFKDVEKQAIRMDAIKKERKEIVELIQSMADEVGAPTLLNAVVLAINVRNYPEE